MRKNKKNYHILNYSENWFKSASLDQLHTERKKVQDDFLNNDLDMDYRIRMRKLLQCFDCEISKREWAGKEPDYPKHSEHGWYLPSDD